MTPGPPGKSYTHQHTHACSVKTSVRHSMADPPQSYWLASTPNSDDKIPAVSSLLLPGAPCLCMQDENNDAAGHFTPRNSLSYKRAECPQGTSYSSEGHLKPFVLTSTSGLLCESFCACVPACVWHVINWSASNEVCNQLCCSCDDVLFMQINCNWS